jgi:hypothetical protein
MARRSGSKLDSFRTPLHAQHTYSRYCMRFSRGESLFSQRPKCPSNRAQVARTGSERCPRSTQGRRIGGPDQLGIRRKTFHLRKQRTGGTRAQERVADCLGAVDLPHDADPPRGRRRFHIPRRLQRQHRNWRHRRSQRAARICSGIPRGKGARRLEEAGCPSRSGAPRRADTGDFFISRGSRRHRPGRSGGLRAGRLPHSGKHEPSNPGSLPHRRITTCRQNGPRAAGVRTPHRGSPEHDLHGNVRHQRARRGRGYRNGNVHRVGTNRSAHPRRRSRAYAVAAPPQSARQDACGRRPRDCDPDSACCAANP